MAQFTASVAGTYVVQLAVSSGDQADARACIVEVTQFSARIDAPAVAEVSGSIPLDGAESVAPEGATFVWTVVPAGARVIVEDDDPKLANFLPDDRGTFAVTLTISAEVAGQRGPETISTSVVHHVEVTANTETGGEDDELFWRDRLQAKRRSAPEDVRASAAKWEASLTAFLGVFAAVSFLVGPKTLTDVERDFALFGISVIGIAFAVALYARVMLADVANATPVYGRALTPLQYRAKSWEAAEAGAEKLRRSRELAIWAAVIVAVGTSVVAYGAVEEKPAATPKAMVRTTTETLCGELSTDESGRVSIAGTPVGPAEEIVLVANCNPPKPPPAPEAEQAD